MKYLILVLLITGCKGNPSHGILTKAETALLDSLQFDRSLVADVKAITKKPFTKVEVSNESGREIPGYLTPKMISCTVDQSVELSQIDNIKEKAKGLGYNIYSLNQQDGLITIIISKLNQ